MKSRIPRRRRLVRKKRVIRVARKPRISRPMTNRSEYATCRELYDVKGMQSNTPYSDIEQNLAFYPRAAAIAENYQFFRIKYVKYTFIQRYNVFQATTDEANAFPMPQLYFQIDKAGSLPTNTAINQLKEMGCKPHKFTRNIVVAWKPGVSITTGNQNNAAQLNTGVKISPWLMTNRSPETAGWVVNDTDHKGLYWEMSSAALPGDGTYSYDAEVEVVFEFKKPLGQPTASQPPAIRVSTLQKKRTLPNGTEVENITT